MENNKNKKTFIAIIVVATLIIAIMGATFAFFSASGGSANNAVTANATTLANLGLTSHNSKIATNLVPVASESPYFSRYPGTGASGCLDDVGNEICTVYEFTITNTASVTQTIYVSLVPSENTFDNIYFAAFNTTAASADYTVATGSSGSGSNFTLTAQTTASNSTLSHTATKLTKNNTSPVDMPGLSTTLSSGASVTYTILVWLQETGNSQNDEQGGVFKVGVNVTTGGNSTGVTGIMEDNYVYTVSTATASIGEALPNGMNTYTTGSSAMEHFDNRPFYLKHKITNDVIEESYVEFVVTPEMASANTGMTVGTYTLIGDDGTSYSTNVDTLTTAFGIGNCVDSKGFGCSVTGLSASAASFGLVTASISNDKACDVDGRFGSSSCHGIVEVSGPIGG